MNGLISTEALKFPFLSTLSNRYLSVGQEFSHFVQENCSPVCKFETANPPLCRSRERPFLVAE